MGAFPLSQRYKLHFGGESHDLMASREGLMERQVNTSKKLICACISYILTAMSLDPGGAMGAFHPISALKIAILEVKAMIPWPQGST